MVSPRRNHVRREAAPEPLDLERLRRGVQSVHAASDGEWLVRTVPASGAQKEYRCPGCDQEIRPGVPMWWRGRPNGRGRGGLTTGGTGTPACWRAPAGTASDPRSRPARRAAATAETG